MFSSVLESYIILETKILLKSVTSQPLVFHLKLFYRTVLYLTLQMQIVNKTPPKPDHTFKEKRL